MTMGLFFFGSTYDMMNMESECIIILLILCSSIVRISIQHPQSQINYCDYAFLLFSLYTKNWRHEYFGSVEKFVEN